MPDEFSGELVLGSARLQRHTFCDEFGSQDVDGIILLALRTLEVGDRTKAEKGELAFGSWSC